VHGWASGATRPGLDCARVCLPGWDVGMKSSLHLSKSEYWDEPIRLLGGDRQICLATIILVSCHEFNGVVQKLSHRP